MSYKVDHTLPTFLDPKLNSHSDFLTIAFNQISQLVLNLLDENRERTLCLRQLEMAHFYAQKSLSNPKELI